MGVFFASTTGLLCVLLAAAPWLAWQVQGEPGRALASALVALLCATALAWARRRRLPLEITTLLLLPPAIAWGLGEGFGLFVRVRHWDLVAHTTAGFAIGMLVLPLLLAWLGPVRRRWLLALLASVAIAALAGVLWELGEWVVDAWIGSTTLGDVHDTLSDLAADLAGATAGAGAALWARALLPDERRSRLALAFRSLAHPR